MNTRLLTMAAMQGGVFTFDEAATLGLSGDDLTTLVRAGSVTRLRRRAYVLTQTYAAADVDEKYRLRVLAVLRSRPRRDAAPQDRASHQSALALHGIAFFKASRTMVCLESTHGPQRLKDGLRVARRSTAMTFSSRNARAVSPAAACVQVAARDGFEAGVCAMDSALHRRKCTTADLEEAVALVARGKRGLVQRTIAFADARAESVGESRTRIILHDSGFSVVPQFEVRDGRSVLGRVDFLVDGCVVVEFDGLIKYEKYEGKYAIGAEKQREKEIRRLGYEFVRIVWSELDDPLSIARQVIEAKRDAQRRGILATI